MKTNERLFLDIHVIQTLPPSNINRDDTGSPKTAQYGGIRRARVSSQSWKRVMRQYFNEFGGLSNVGTRTLHIVDYVASKIITLDSSIDEDEAIKLATDILGKAGISLKDKQAKALIFISDYQANRLAEAALNGEDDKKALKSIIKEVPSIDIALFGRMLADDPSLNEDASSQIAHAISTHGITTEYDFFTAVDDLSSKDNAGAGMLGTIEFNSSTLYRYGNISLHGLMSQLDNKESVVNTASLFVEAFCNSLPNGKVNSFANQTFPQLVVVSLRNDRPVNLVGAFEKPVKSNDGYVSGSIKKLCDEFKKSKKFVKEPIFTTFVVMDYSEELSVCGAEEESLSDLLASLRKSIDEFLVEGN